MCTITLEPKFTLLDQTKSVIHPTKPLERRMQAIPLPIVKVPEYLGFKKLSEVQMFSSYRSPRLIRAISLPEYVEIVRSGGPAVPYDKKSEVYQELKSNTNCVAINARFNGKAAYETFVQSSGYIFLDLDNGTSKDFAELDFICMASYSLSCTGIHFIGRLDPVVTDWLNRNPRHFKYVYEYISKTYFNGQLDPCANKITQYTVIPRDQELIYKEAIPLNIPVETLEGLIEDDATYHPQMYLDEGLSSIRYEHRIPDSKFKDVNLPIYKEMEVFNINLHAFKNFKLREGRRHKIFAGLSIRLIGLNQSSSFTDLLGAMHHLNNTICEEPLNPSELYDILRDNYDKYLKHGIGPWLKYRKKRCVWWHSRTSNDAVTKRKLGSIYRKRYKAEKYQKTIAGWIHEMILQSREVITKKRISEVTGLSKDIVQDYWLDTFDEVINAYNANFRSVLKSLKLKKVQKVSSKKVEYTTLHREYNMYLSSFSDTKKCTFLKIDSAIKEIMSRNEPITQRVISNATSISLRTVNGYWKYFKPVVTDYKKELRLRHLDGGSNELIPVLTTSLGQEP